MNSTSLVPRPCPEKSEEGLVTLAPFPVSAESAYYVTNTFLGRYTGTCHGRGRHT